MFLKLVLKGHFSVSVVRVALLLTSLGLNAILKSSGLMARTLIEVHFKVQIGSVSSCCQWCGSEPVVIVVILH